MSVQVDYQFWSAQRQALEELQSGQHDVVVFRGGYGSGKSVLGARATIMTAAKISGHYLVMGQDFSKGRDTYEVLFDEMPGEDLNPFAAGDPENSPLVQKYNHNEKRIVFYNGSVIVLGSADKWNRYAGAEFNLIWCDEVAHYDNTDLYKLNEMLISRQRTSEGPNISLWTSTGNGFNDFYDFVEKKVDREGNQLTTRVKNVIANSLNNPFLNEKEKLRRQFKDTSRESEALRGGFAATSGMVYEGFNRNKHVVSSDEFLDDYSDYKRILVGGDSGWHPDPRALVVVGVTGSGDLHVLDEFYRNKVPVYDEDRDDTAADWLEDKPYDIDKIFHDPSEPEDISDYQRAGFVTVKGENSIMPGVQQVSRYFSDKNRKRVLISEDCTNFINEVVSYKYPDSKRRDKPEDANNHLMDSFRYLCMGIKEGNETWLL